MAKIENRFDTFTFPIHGICKLRDGDPPYGSTRDCHEEIMAYNEYVLRRLGALQRAVERFLDKPGCNIPQRAGRMQQLRWELDKSTEL